MTRTITLKEYLLEELNRRARERGEEVELVFERPQPWLAVKEGQSCGVAVGTEDGRGMMENVA